jgi:hypothetical protein
VSIFAGSRSSIEWSRDSRAVETARKPGLDLEIRRRYDMRFMIIVKADKNFEAGALPDKKILTEMGKFNEELVKAGVMPAAEGLKRAPFGRLT